MVSYAVCDEMVSRALYIAVGDQYGCSFALYLDNLLPFLVKEASVCRRGNNLPRPGDTYTRSLHGCPVFVSVCAHPCAYIRNKGVRRSSWRPNSRWLLGLYHWKSNQSTLERDRNVSVANSRAYHQALKPKSIVAFRGQV